MIVIVGDKVEPDRILCLYEQFFRGSGSSQVQYICFMNFIQVDMRKIGQKYFSDFWICWYHVSYWCTVAGSGPLKSDCLQYDLQGFQTQ